MHSLFKCYIFWTKPNIFNIHDFFSHRHTRSLEKKPLSLNMSLLGRSCSKKIVIIGISFDALFYDFDFILLLLLFFYSFLLLSLILTLPSISCSTTHRFSLRIYCVLFAEESIFPPSVQQEFAKFIKILSRQQTRVLQTLTYFHTYKFSNCRFQGLKYLHT